MPSLHHASLYLLFLRSHSSAFFNANNETRHFPLGDKTYGGSVQGKDPLNLDFSDSCDVVLLPIFPLRKRVRFPTDTLMLNLYEERYLAMSEFILSSQDSTQKIPPSDSQTLLAPIFGAIYSSDKPQIVANGGSSPITPMLSRGDVGVLCLVKDWMDGMMPTRKNGRNSNAFEGDNQQDDAEVDTTAFQRRIRLNAVAVTRFCILKIVQESPFIVVEAQVWRDDRTFDYDTTQLKGLEQELRRVLQQKSAASDQEVNAPNGDAVTAFSTTNTLEAVEEICSTVRYNGIGSVDQRNELISFLAISTLTDGAANIISPKDLSSMLRTKSLQKRMDILRFYRPW
jgi:hypothetical protein